MDKKANGHQVQETGQSDVWPGGMLIVNCMHSGTRVHCGAHCATTDWLETIDCYDEYCTYLPPSLSKVRCCKIDVQRPG